MWSFPIGNGLDSSSEDGSGGSDGKVTVAKQVEPSACELRCKIEQYELVSCVDSIRAAKASSSNAKAGNSESSTSSDGNNEESTAETPACLPLAIAAWTKCCTEANDLQLEQQQQQQEEEEKKEESS